MPKRLNKRSIRRALGKASSQTYGNTGRKKLAGLASGNRASPAGTKPNPPTKITKAQKKLGNRIRTLREENGLTPVQLGKDSGISTVKLGMIESGEVNVSLSTMVRLARRLHVNLASLLRGIE